MVRGPGATAFLDRLTTNKLPKVGRINLTFALTDTGTMLTEYTIVRPAQDSYTWSRQVPGQRMTAITWSSRLKISWPLAATMSASRT